MAGKQQVGNWIGLAGLALIVLAIGASCVYGHESSSSSKPETTQTPSNDTTTEYVASPTVTTSALSGGDANFIGSIRAVGISLADNEAILQAHAVCLFVEPPNGGSIFDAMQQVQQMHGEWDTVTTTHFVDYSIINYCPDRAPTP